MFCLGLGLVSASSGNACKQKLTDWCESTSEDELAREYKIVVQDTYAAIISEHGAYTKIFRLTGF
jgi:hypothetical protein